MEHYTRFDRLVGMIRHQLNEDADVLLERCDILVLLHGIRSLQDANGLHRWKPNKDSDRNKAQRIIANIAFEHGVDLDEMLSTSRRTRKVTSARQAAIRIIHEACVTLSVLDIAALFNCNHSSIIHTLGRRSNGQPPDLRRAA